MSSIPDQPPVLAATGYALIDALLETNQVEQARVHLEKLGDSERKDARGLELEARILWQEQNVQLLEAHLDFADSELALTSPEHRWFIQSFRARIDGFHGNPRSGIETLTAFLTSYEQALATAQLVDSHIWLGNAWFRLREIDMARGHYSKALRLSEASTNSRGIAVAIGSLGRCDRVDGKWDRAIAMSEHAIRLFERSGDLRGVAVECGQLGVLRLFRGYFATAASNLDRAVSLGFETADPNVISYDAAIGLLSVRTGRPDACGRLLGALRKARAARSPRPYALVCEFIGEWSLAQARWKSAGKWLHRALQVARPAGFRDIEGEVQCRLAELELALMRPLDALDRIGPCIADFDEMNDVYELAVARRIRAQVLLALGRVSEAREDLGSALRFFQSVDERFESERVERLLTAADQRNAVWDIRNDSATFPIKDEANSLRESQLSDRCTFDLTNPNSLTNPARHGAHRIHHPNFPRILGISAVLFETLELIKRCAPSNSPVLIEGETGTGKELLARAIHDLSPRAKRPFIPFNCGTSTPEVFDAEICGYVRGAFTGAVNSRAGLVRAAEGGTLFLDEVAELTHAIQPRLLRLLDIGEIRPVGSDEVLRADVRVVAATHQDMDEAVEAKRFRPDLFYRLCTFRVKVPSLRERLDDLPLLVQHFSNEAQMNGYPAFVGVSTTVIGKMARYGWPGNIRELRNEVLRLAQRSTPGEKAKHWNTPESPFSLESGEPIGAYIWEREKIVRELAAARGSVATVARRLGISRARVYRLLAHWEIDLSSFRSK